MDTPMMATLHGKYHCKLSLRSLYWTNVEQLPDGPVNSTHGIECSKVILPQAKPTCLQSQYLLLMGAANVMRLQIGYCQNTYDSKFVAHVHF